MTTPFSDPQQRIAFFQQWFSDTIPHSKALGLKIIAVAPRLRPPCSSIGARSWSAIPRPACWRAVR